MSFDPAPIDRGFVESARNKLMQIPLVNQVYSRFKSDGLFNHDHDLYLSQQLAPNGGRVYMAADGKELDAVVVPGLFTSYGFVEQFLVKGKDYVKEANEQNWVLGVKNADELGRTRALVRRF